MHAAKYNSPRQAPAVQYYNHFPNTFLRPYCKVDKPVTEGKIMTDAKPINCEWFGRPSIAVSEMAESICENVDVIERGLSDLTAHEVGTNLRQLADTMNALKGTSDVITYLPQTALNLPQNPVKYVKSCRLQTFSRRYTSNFALLPLRVRLWPPSWNTQ